MLNKIEFEKILLLANGAGVPVYTGENVIPIGSQIIIEHPDELNRIGYFFSTNEELDISLDGWSFFKLKHLISSDYKLLICGKKKIHVKNNTTTDATLVWSIWDLCEHLITFEYPCQICGSTNVCEHRR